VLYAKFGRCTSKEKYMRLECWAQSDGIARWHVEVVHAERPQQTYCTNEKRLQTGGATRGLFHSWRMHSGCETMMGAAKTDVLHG
jgi:hypothetical protein